MTRGRWPERIAMRLARLVAGPERKEWLEAMEAELDALADGRFEWALGGLVAATRDRAWRERGVLALVLAPTAALAAIPIASILLSLLAEFTRPSVMQLAPIIALTPLPFAIALGALRPERSAVMSGVLGFAAYQAIPAIALPLLFGQYVYVRWEANLTAFGMLPPSGFAGSFGLWCFGAWIGARRARRLSPPSP